MEREPRQSVWAQIVKPANRFGSLCKGTGLTGSRIARLRRHVCVLSIALALITPATANEFADNPYKVLSDRSRISVFSPIGMAKRARREGDGHGTAVIVGPCTVLTAYHVPFGQNQMVVHPEQYTLKLSFGIGAKEGGFASVSVGVPFSYGNLVTKDFALIHDKSCPGLKYGWYETSNVSSDGLAARSATVLAVSFPEDLPQGTVALSRGIARGVDEDTGYVMYDASTAPGSSGAPVFVVDENGILRLQGIHIGGAKDNSNYKYPNYSSKRANEFLNLADIFDQHDVALPLARDRAEHPSPNPIAGLLRVK